MNIDSLCDRIKTFLDADFFEKYYGKKHVLLQLNMDAAHNLFSDTQIEAFIRFAATKEKSPQVFFYGHAVNQSYSSSYDSSGYDHLMRLNRGGASLIYNQTQKVSSRIAYLTNFLEHQFECKTHGNLYVTPAKMTAFNPHYDKHDVLVIQLRGSKKWSFYEPLDKQHKGNTFKKEQVREVKNLTLAPGSLLYVPQGLIHAAESTNEASWHITLGLTGYYWKDALKDLIDTAANPSNLELFRRLPIESGKQGDFNKQASALFEMMKGQLDFSAGFTKFKKEYPGIADHQAAIPTYSFQNPESIADNQLFEFIDLDQLSIEESEDRISLQTPSREHGLHLKRSTLSLINRMKKAHEFSCESIMEEESGRDIKLFFSFLMENNFIKPVQQ
jgi:ribosomal protein L16 Arg81 hydroxylase